MRSYANVLSLSTVIGIFAFHSMYWASIMRKHRYDVKNRAIFIPKFMFCVLLPNHIVNFAFPEPARLACISPFLLLLLHLLLRKRFLRSTFYCVMSFYVPLLYVVVQLVS